MKDTFEPKPGAAKQAIRMPAEWEPQARVWLCRPHNAETWPGCLDEAIEQFDGLLNTLGQYVETTCLDELGIATNDSWIRDFGPIFLVQKQKKGSDPFLLDFRFDGWGGKYGPHDQDNQVPQQMAKHLNFPSRRCDLVLEGGAIDTNGCGSLLLSQYWARRANRQTNLSQSAFESQLHDVLGTSHAVWLPGEPIRGDDTDGHVDNVARFVSSDSILAVRAAQSHPDHEVLERNWQCLRSARDPGGHPWQLWELPAPQPLFYDYPPDRFDCGGRQQLPASYANFLITNGAVLMPTFAQKRDEEALRVLERIFDDRTVIGIPCEKLIVGQGGIHCLTLPQPL